MAIEYIKDGNGQIIGSKNGDWIRGRDGHQIAKYNKGIDETVGSDAKRIGKGDQRLTALERDRNKKK